MKMWVYNLCLELYQNGSEVYTIYLWPSRLDEKVKVFIRYNADKALQNRSSIRVPGYCWRCGSICDEQDFNRTSNHDFFSQVGNGYLLGSVEQWMMKTMQNGCNFNSNRVPKGACFLLILKVKRRALATFNNYLKITVPPQPGLEATKLQTLSRK